MQPTASATSTAPASSRAAALAGRIKPAVSHQGFATAYAAGDGSGSCLSADGTGCGGALRITGIYGDQLTVDGIAVRPDVAQPTGVQFAGH